MSMALVGAALIAGGSQIAAGQQAASAQNNALGAANAQTQAGIRAQTAATGQQLELARPLIQTRDNALGKLQVLFGLPQTAPSQIAATPGFSGTSGQGLIALPGVRVIDQTKKKDSTSAADLLGAFSKPGRDEISTSAYYDPARRAFVDANGAVVDQSKLVHGSNNTVRVGADGQLYSVGSRGENALGITLPTITAGQGMNEAAGSTFIPGSATNPATDRTSLINELMQTPGIQFVDQQGQKQLDQMFAARGLRRSGSAYAAGIQRASDLASTNYTNLVLNPLFKLAGFGQEGAAQAGGALAQQGVNATNNASTLANLALQSGNARASSYQATGQAIGDLASNLSNIYARGGLAGSVGKSGPLTATKTPSSASPLAGYIVNGPNGAFNDPTGLYSSIYGGN